MNKLNLTFSIAAGLLGGTVAPYLFPISAQAQAKSVAPKVLEAQAFRLVSEAGNVAGTLTIDAAGSGIINLFDSSGKIIWTSDSKPIIKPVVGR